MTIQHSKSSFSVKRKNYKIALNVENTTRNVLKYKTKPSKTVYTDVL